MLDLMNNLSNENLVIICFILGTIALALAIAISIEMYIGNKRYTEQLKNTSTRLNIKEDARVKYVEENVELEKTKAKIELEELKEKLKKEEEQKQKLIETNLALANTVAEKQEEIEKLEDTVTDLKPVIEEIANREVNIEVSPKEEIKEENNYSDEEDAIISYEELKSAKNFGYSDQEMAKYVDEKDAIISMQELEKLYYESQNIEVPTKNELNEKATELRENISSVYESAKTDQDLVLEQTANLEKLNEEIKKTNEFLKMLKDLKKNLD